MKAIMQKIYTVILIGIILCYSSATIYGQKPQLEEPNIAQKTLQEMGIEYTRDAFQKAIYTGDVDVVRLFVNTSLDFVDEMDKKEMILESTFSSISRGQVAIVGILLDLFPIDIFLEQEIEKDLIKAAISSSNTTMVNLLLDRNIGVNYIKTITLKSLIGDDIAIIKLLERRGIITVKGREFEITRNEHHTIEAMRLFHSVQATYQAGLGNGNFGSAEEIFKNGFIDGALANAAGVRPMEAEGIKCIGDGSAKNGYKFLIFKKDADQKNLADFVVIALPVISQGENRTGDHGFYVDATGVIRMCNANETPSENSRPISN